MALWHISPLNASGPSTADGEIKKSCYERFNIEFEFKHLLVSRSPLRSILKDLMLRFDMVSCFLTKYRQDKPKRLPSGVAVRTTEKTKL